jgi:hypothetical protein
VSARSGPDDGTRAAARQAPASLGPVGIPGTITPTSLTLPPGLSYAEWRHVGHLLGQIKQGVGFWLADWILYGEGHYGERFAQAVGETGLAPQTVENLLVVGRAFPPARRRAVSVSHHAALTRLPPAIQDRYLEESERKGWSVTELRQAVRGSLPREAAPPAPDPEDTRPRLIVGGLVQLERAGLCKVVRVTTLDTQAVIYCVRL